MAAAAAAGATPTARGAAKDFVWISNRSSILQSHAQAPLGRLLHAAFDIHISSLHSNRSEQSAQTNTNNKKYQKPNLKTKLTQVNPTKTKPQHRKSD